MIGSNQTTIGKTVEFEGVGLHGGKAVHMQIAPADADYGIVFEMGGEKIPACVANVSSTVRNTGLSNGRATVHTVEHVLSALYGMGVDNARIIMDADEPPALDGSSSLFAEVLSRAGTRELGKAVKIISLREPVLIQERDAIVLFMPSANFRALYVLDHPHPLIGRETALFDGDPNEYRVEIAPARTFGLIEEVEGLRKAGLALGGSAENAVVVYPDRYSSELRFPSEFARHKLLDLIGDLSLLGCRLKAHCASIRGGHAINVKAVKEIAGLAPD
jgi:UDP-3-O-[3-hydroxymyristoyl] N-acetylglucosamine deacetylase